MLEHQVISNTTNHLLSRKDLREHPKVPQLQSKGSLISSLILELNDANKNDTCRHLLLTSDKMSCLLKQFQEDLVVAQHNQNNITISSLNHSQNPDSSVLLVRSSIHSQDSDIIGNITNSTANTSLIRQAVFRPGQEVDDIVHQNIALEQLCQQQDMFLREVYEECESMTNQTLTWKKEALEIKQHTLLIEKTTQNLEKDFEREANTLKEDINELTEQCKLLDIDIEGELEKENNIRQSNQEIKAELEQLLAEEQELAGQLESEENIIKELNQENEQMVQSISSKELLEKRLLLEISQSLADKKALNDELQRIKGNIRVYCRVRPLSKMEIADEKITNCIAVSSSNNITLQVPNQVNNLNKLAFTWIIELFCWENFEKFLKSDNNQHEYRFHFEQIFDANASQETIFTELSQLIQSLIDGFNVCIFAYGQTGTGKTFTMEGGSTPESKGLMQRSMEMIFKQVEYLKAFDWEYKLFVSFQEVYMEAHRDLITGLKIADKPEFVEITSLDEFNPLLKKSRDNRKVGSTQCNDQSSRSHSIFQLKMQGNNAKENKTTCGTLNLIDLAGSERVAQSQVSGVMLEETKFINKSLTALGDVINALAMKDKYVPFRNSKLTFILQNYLGEGSKTLMFLNLSPASNSYNQTLCSLRFGDKVSNIKLKKK